MAGAQQGAKMAAAQHALWGWCHLLRLRWALRPAEQGACGAWDLRLHLWTQTSPQPGPLAC